MKPAKMKLLSLDFDGVTHPGHDTIHFDPNRAAAMPGPILLAQLKAQGKPITPGTLELAQTRLPTPSESINTLARALATLKSEALPKDVAEAVQRAISQLDRIKEQWQANGGALHQELHDALLVLGHSIERELAQPVKADPNLTPSPPLHLAAQRHQI